MSFFKYRASVKPPAEVLLQEFGALVDHRR